MATIVRTNLDSTTPTPNYLQNRGTTDRRCYNLGSAGHPNRAVQIRLNSRREWVGAIAARPSNCYTSNHFGDATPLPSSKRLSYGSGSTNFFEATARCLGLHRQCPQYRP